MSLSPMETQVRLPVNGRTGRHRRQPTDPLDGASQVKHEVNADLFVSLLLPCIISGIAYLLSLRRLSPHSHVKVDTGGEERPHRQFLEC